MARTPTFGAGGYRCPRPDCKALCVSRSVLKRHERVHSSTKPFVCDFVGCSRAFKARAYLQTHQLIHRKLKPHICDQNGCKSAFRQRGSLQRHKRAHLKIRPHKCTYSKCERAFASLGNLQAHERTHTGIKPYSCDREGCTASFAQRNDLAVHERGVHQNIRPYLCNHEGCGSSFASSRALVIHTRTHTGCRPFACDYDGCGSSFTQSAHLVVHTRTHTGVLPYKCPFPACEVTFINTSNCKAHYFYHHTTEGQQHRKREEERVAKLLKSAGIDFKREHHVSFSCTGGTFARTDFMIVEGGKVIVLEVDEHQHEWYAVACEVSRMAKLFEAWLLEGNGLPVYFLRYNPNAYQVDGKKARVPKKVREERLLGAIQEAIESEGDGMRVRYMYYDIVSGKPAIMQDPAFTIEDCCVEAVFKRVSIGCIFKESICNGSFRCAVFHPADGLRSGPLLSRTRERCEEGSDKGVQA